MFGKEIFTLTFSYNDFIREWYIIVANKLLLPFFLLVINPHTGEMLKAVFGSYIRILKNKFSKNVRTFLKNNTLLDFDLAFKFKNVMKMLFICFTFSSAIPILNIFIFFGIFLCFWMHKKIFITHSGKSPSYSSSIIKTIIYTVKMIYLIHVAFAIIFISNKDVFP